MVEYIVTVNNTYKLVNVRSPMLLDQNKPLDVDEMRVLKYLFPDHKRWLRNITYKNIGFNTTTAKRTIMKLEKKGYVANDKTQSWKRGQKISYYLTPKGKIATSQIIAGEAGKNLFINILEKVLDLAQSWDGSGEKEAETAIDIVNLLDNKEAGENIERIVIDLLKSLEKE